MGLESLWEYLWGIVQSALGNGLYAAVAVVPAVAFGWLRSRPSRTERPDGPVAARCREVWAYLNSSALALARLLVALLGLLAALLGDAHEWLRRWLGM
ncbi:MAG: hypothetical protein H6733_16955 [Alphaproteobacteria bacterium]|nr:hypothetical protein [Alphaproteobacteria bacterium]